MKLTGNGNDVNYSSSSLEKGAGQDVILSTKPLPEHLILSAKEAGLQIECIPFIETKPVVNNVLKKNIEALSAESITAIFTSGIAAKAVADMVRISPHWDIFCIQGQTKKNVQRCFPQSVIKGTAGYGKDLLAEILKYPSIKEVVFFCGDRRLKVLPEQLPENGIAVRELVVYNTTLTPVRLEKEYKAILFYSPSGVESFFSVNTIGAEVLLFSIGNTTAKAIKKYSSNKIFTAATADAESMVELVKQKIYN